MSVPTSGEYMETCLEWAQAYGLLQSSSSLSEVYASDNGIISQATILFWSVIELEQVLTLT